MTDPLARTARRTARTAAVLLTLALAACPEDNPVTPPNPPPEADVTAPVFATLRRLAADQEVADGATIAVGEVRIRGSVTDAGMITALTVRVNDGPTQTVPDFVPSEQVPFDFGATLREGLNTLVLTARDAAGNVATATVRLTFERAGGRSYTTIAAEGDVGATAIAIDASGRVHVVWRDKPAGYIRPQLLYSNSADGGASWSTPQNLTLASGHDASAPRVVVDGAGRVYVFWTARNDFIVYAGRLGDLHYRVLENGVWSAPAQIGANHDVTAWFAALDGAGQLHVVWNEHRPWNGNNPEEGGRIYRTRATGSAHSAPELLYDAPTRSEGGVIPRWFVTGFRAMSGYIDAAGRARWVAEKHVTDEPARLIHWDGAEERVLMPVSQLGTTSFDVQGGPRLVADASGREHLILYRNQGGVRAVVALDPAQGLSATTLYQLPAGGAEIRRLQVARAATGRILVTVQAQETTPGDHDLFLTSFDGGAWSATLNVTENGARVRTVQSVTTRYSAHEAAAVLDAAGRVNLAITEQEARWSNAIYISGSAITRLLFTCF